MVDPTVDVVSRVLSANGILPSWIDKQKLVTELTAHLKTKLLGDIAAAYLAANASAADGAQWQQPDQIETIQAVVASDRHSALTTELNASIDAYNLEVPNYNLQKGRIKLAWLAESMFGQIITDRAQAQHLINSARRTHRSVSNGGSC